MIVDFVIGLIGFSAFVILQALLINGLKEAMREGMILQWFPWLVNRVIRNEFWRKPWHSCVQCMSGPFGTVSFWGVILPVFGFHYQEIPISIADCFILVFVNGIIYKKL